MPRAEFAALPEARAAIERLLQRIDITLASRDDGAPQRVTFSAGLAQAQPGEPLQQALERADAALYRAKQGGRHQLVVAP